MSVAAAKWLDHENEVERRLAILRRAEARRARLERLFRDSAFLDKVLKQGRYLRLCAAIAWASELEERARLAVETDVNVETLRLAAAARRPT
jgi:hypothetical protein